MTRSLHPFTDGDIAGLAAMLERPAPGALAKDAEARLLDEAAEVLAARLRIAVDRYGGSRDAPLIAIYRSDADLSAITCEPWRAALHRQLVMRAAFLAGAPLAARFGFVEIGAGSYFKWLGERENTQDMRGEYAARHARKSPPWRLGIHWATGPNFGGPGHGLSALGFAVLNLREVDKKGRLIKRDPPERVGGGVIPWSDFK